MTRLFSAILFLAFIGHTALASQRLVYLEAQVVAGYSFQDRKVFWYSMDQMDAMQKPSIGFDFLQRLAGQGGDWGLLAVQARLAYDSTRKYSIEPQLYNAYIKFKPGFGNVWLGHNKPAFGLASYLDNHGTVLQPLSMYGFGYDRDWGAGYYRDFDWGSAALSATLGSGMPFYARGNYLLAGRIAKCDLNRDNYTVGFSASYGRTLETMGYQLQMPDPREQTLVGLDGSWRWNNVENRAELQAGKQHGGNVQAILWQGSLNLLPESRLKLEYQPVYSKVGGSAQYQFLAGLSWTVTSSLTARAVFWADHPGRSRTAIAQMYWYHKL